MADKSPADLAREMLALLEKATPGRWLIDNDDSARAFPIIVSSTRHIAVLRDDEAEQEDLHLIAFARNNAEAICRRLVELEAHVAKLVDIFDEATPCDDAFLVATPKNLRLVKP